MGRDAGDVENHDIGLEVLNDVAHGGAALAVLTASTDLLEPLFPM